MGPDFIATLCEHLSEQGTDPSVIEEIRVWLGAFTLALQTSLPSHPAPSPLALTQWTRPAIWRGRPVAWLVGTGPFDEAQLSSLMPLLAWSVVQNAERQQTEARMTEVQVRAGRAMELSELVTWLLHARDLSEVERLGTFSVASLLRVDAGALLTRRPDGRWRLRVPAQDLIAEGLELTGSRHLDLLSRDKVELETELLPGAGPLEQALYGWGFRQAFSVPLDSGNEPQGVLLALSMTPRVTDPEARVAAGQLSIMIAVALDRLHDQRRLAEHRRSLEDALRLASMGTWELDLKTLQVTWSRELHQLYGGGFRELTQPHAAAEGIFEAEDRVLHDRHLRDLLGKGSTTPSQLRVATLDGRRLWVRTLYELIFDGEGAPQRVHAVTRDVTLEVTSQLERERALERATRYERLFSLSNTLAAVADEKGIIEEASPSWARQLGWSPAELQGMPMSELIHPDDLAQLGPVGERLAQGHPTGAVSRVRSKRGEWRWVSWTAGLDDGRYYAAATDVTSLEQTSQRLRQSQEQLQQAGALARVGGWDYDLLTHHIEWSSEMRRIYDVGPEYVPTLQDQSPYYSAENLASIRESVKRCVAEGADFDIEVAATSATGRKFWARHIGSAERVDGRTVRVFGAVQDVTEQHQAREEALTASRVKSQFLANTSHEIRTPLNGILGMTQLALQTHLNGEQREYLEAVRTSGDNLLAIVNDILDISKIESGRLELERIPFSAHRVIHEAVRTHAGRAHGKDLELVVDVHPGMPELLMGDPVRFGQIVTNLLGNAVKFTERGEISLSVFFTNEQVKLSVRDTGIGIPADRVSSIFEAFTQADGSTNRRFGGTGLGLTITLELVRAMGGRIEVESTVGAGSTFHAWLGLSAAPSAPRLAAPAQGLRVMVVSGNSRQQAVTVSQLEHLGCEVIAVPADQAIQRLLEYDGKELDLVVMDQELQGSTGIELCEAMEVHDGLNRLPRMLLTRTTHRPIASALKAVGVQRVLTRPVSTHELAETLAQFKPGAGFSQLEVPVATRHTRRPLKVLLAEDNAINARLAQRLLERLGHQVTHVTDGARAVTVVSEGRWDAVLMDMQMPVLDGLDATRAIRAAERSTGAHVTIIALTANAMKGDDLVCLEAGMDAYLTKPIDLDRLTAMLDALTAPVTGMTA